MHDITRTQLVSQIPLQFSYLLFFSKRSERFQDTPLSSDSSIHLITPLEPWQRSLTLSQRLRYAYRALAIALHNLYCVPAYLMWMLLISPLRFLAPDLHWGTESVLYSCLLHVVGYWVYSSGQSGIYM